MYTTGVMTRERMVELMSPPIMTMARGEMRGLVEMAMGKSPPMAVSDVRTIGRKRISPASRIACYKGMPFSRN